MTTTTYNTIQDLIRISGNRRLISRLFSPHPKSKYHVSIVVRSSAELTFCASHPPGSQLLDVRMSEFYSIISSSSVSQPSTWPTINPTRTALYFASPQPTIQLDRTRIFRPELDSDYFASHSLTSLLIITCDRIVGL